MGHTVRNGYSGVKPGLRKHRERVYSENRGTLRLRRAMIKCVLSVWDKSDQISIDWKHGLEPRY